MDEPQGKRVFIESLIKKASEEVFSQLRFAFCVSVCENMIPGGFAAIL